MGRGEVQSRWSPNSGCKLDKPVLKPPGNTSHYSIYSSQGPNTQILFIYGLQMTKKTMSSISWNLQMCDKMISWLSKYLMINFLLIDCSINRLILQLHFGHFAEVYILSFHYDMFLFALNQRKLVLCRSTFHIVTIWRTLYDLGVGFSLYMWLKCPL